MVLFKRKPVQFLPRPQIDDENADCWIIPETEEVFLSYESYLQRMDWYKARRFICQISGHSGLSFFDALKSERAGAREVEGAFPEMLKGPVLRKVQFSTVSRIDNLVDQVYDEFKQDFFPGEQVTVLVEGERVNGTVRDKAKFPEIRNPDTGEVTREAFARYFVRLAENPDQETLVDDSKVTRDRKVFTKQMLRSFIKNTVSREAWTGAPWLVHENVAHQYKIDTDVPHHLQHSYKVAEKKERRKNEQQDGKVRKSLTMAPDGVEMTRSEYEDIQLLRINHLAWTGRDDPVLAAHMERINPAAGHRFLQNGHANYSSSQLASKGEPHPPTPPAPIKYPVEDMDCPPRRDGVQRPPLKFLAQSQCVGEASDNNIIPGLHDSTVGLLLETWNTLNVYCQVLLLDSFTFDDFVQAMQFSSSEVDCELVTEIHCAVLKKLVNPENEQNGAVQVSLPDLPDAEESEEEEEEVEESHVSTPTPEPDVPARRTRSSLSRMALAEEEKAKSEAPEEVIPHRASEMFGDDDDWIHRLRKRDFKDGGWQMIMVGLLHQVAGRPRLKDVCERVLIHLAPLEADPTLETVRLQYSVMDINLRAEALQIICQLFLETRTVKVFLEEMAKTMTEFRKTKIEHQRSRKESIAALKRLHDDRRLLAPLEQSPTPVAELEELEDAEKFAEVEAEEVADSDEDRPVTTRALRRGQDRAAERKRKREEEEQRKEKAREEKATKGSKEYQRILKNIEKERDKIAEHEEQIEIIDGDLREADAYRTRCLGKDRFCNRYWWFERNAMPYGGLPDSSTADAEYANGRLWVQGPDDMERVGYIDVEDQARNNYYNCFQMTPADRKILEEGSTNLHRAHQWGYYDKPEDMDQLIDWLDQRGFRELKLKKELSLQRDMIARYMTNRRNYIDPTENKTEGGDSADTEDEGPIKPIPTRMSTRTKTYLPEELTLQYRCLRWKNTSAVEVLGHRHVDPPPSREPKTKKGIAKRIVSFEVQPSVPSGPMQTRKKEREAEGMPVNRQGKPVTRQGSRHMF